MAMRRITHQQKKMQGADNDTLPLEFVKHILTIYEALASTRHRGDDYAFQTKLRLLCCLYVFLGGTRRKFIERVAAKLRIAASLDGVGYWIDGFAAPLAPIKTNALTAALDILEELALKRREDISLADIITAQKD